MASLTSTLMLSSPSFHCSSKRINASLQLPELPKDHFTVVKTQARKMVQALKLVDGFTKTTPVIEKNNVTTTFKNDDQSYNESSSTSTITAQFYAILEAVADRVEMHRNIGEKRGNWNSLLLLH